MSVQENIDKVAKAMDKVRNHCMCGRFEDDGASYDDLINNEDWLSKCNYTFFTAD